MPAVPVGSSRLMAAAAKRRLEDRVSNKLHKNVTTLPTDLLDPPATLIPSGTPKPPKRNTSESKTDFLRRMMKERGFTGA